jgi:hypothetical protein
MMRRGCWSALLLGAALVAAPSWPARGRTTHGRLRVVALILPNCLLQVRVVSPRPLVSVDLRCAQATTARIQVVPDAPAAGSRPWSVAMAVAASADARRGQRWLANHRLIASPEGLWVPSLDAVPPARPAARRLTVHVNF